MRTTRQSWVLLFALTVASFAASGAAQQQTGGITGTVVTADGRALAGVEVTVARADIAGAIVRSTKSGDDGRFQFLALPPGAYRVAYSLAGSLEGSIGYVSVVGGQTRAVRVEVRAPDISGGGDKSSPPSQAAPPPPAKEAPPPAASVPPPVGTPSVGDGLAVVPVFYATDRARTVTGAPFSYGRDRNPSGDLALGKFEVSIPRDHRLGEIERPAIWTFWQEDPAKHLVITSRKQQSYEEFYEDVRTVVQQSSRKDAFVFIHGFNVSFEAAVFRTAQIAYDLGFDGAPILYSWPSAEALTPIGYSTDTNNSDWTVPHLRWFLEDVAAKTGATRVHLIAHSMGNKALVNALDRMPRTSIKRFGQIVLTAPDIDAATFIQLADAVKRNSQMATLYASANDKALMASKELQTYRRAGDTRGGVIVVPGIDTVDVSAVDSNLIGHFYYGENTSVISDMFLVLTQGLPPPRRPRLRVAGNAPNQFWRFVP